MIAARKQLKIALETYLIPVFTQAGFSGPSVLTGHSLCYDFRRREGDNYKFLTIQFEKYGGPKFRVNFSEATLAELQERRRLFDEQSGPISRDVLTEPWGSLRGHLHPSRWPYFKLFTWFSMGKDSTLERVSNRAVALYPEIETWWRDRIVGSHLWIPDLFGGRRKQTLKALGPKRAAQTSSPSA